MKATLVLFIFGASFVLGYAFKIEFPNKEDNGWLVPQLDGSLQWMSENSIKELTLETLDIFEIVEIKYYLYTSPDQTKPQSLYINNITSLEQSNFDSRNPTRLIIHGWRNNYQSDVNILIREALLSQGPNNVIVVDWSDGADTIRYIAAANRVPGVGQRVGNFIDFLNEHSGMSFEDLHVFGHSLGAHVSGYAGKNVARGKINTIIGMDPALPMFRFSSPSTRLSSTDASYVETIQTNGGNLGFLEPLAVATFYPNGGKNQPGCGIDLTGACAHSRSYQYLAEALVENSFLSIQCENYKDAVKNNCGNSYSNFKMGSSSNIGVANGVFYTPVNSESPFGIIQSQAQSHIQNK